MSWFIAAFAAFSTAFGGLKDAEWRCKLPRPVYDEKPELLEFYDKAWGIAHTRIDNIPGIPVPLYMDEGHRSDWIWIWGLERARHQRYSETIQSRRFCDG